MKLTEEQKDLRKKARYCGSLAAQFSSFNTRHTLVSTREWRARRSVELARIAAKWAFKAHPELRDEPGGTE